MPRSQLWILALTAAATLAMAVVIGLDSPRRGLLAGGLALGVVLLLGEQVLRNPSAAELRAALAGPAAPGSAEG